MALELVAKKGTTSPIWQFFGFRPDESGQPRDPTEVLCKICSCVVRAKDGQTTNLHDHLRVRHPAEYATLSTRAGPSKKASQGQQMITGAFAKGTKYKTDSNRWRQLTDAVTRFLAKEMVSFNTVEKPSFKAMLRTFDKQYELPGRKYFSKTAIPNLFNEVRSNITKELGDIEYLALTTDMWSSCNMMPYMSVTVHYVNKNWTLQSKCLQTCFIPESHTADNLEEALREAINDWKLQEKQIACITTDNGANIVAAIRQLKWPWLSCFGHNLNLAINNSLAQQSASTDRAFGVCRAVNTAFSHSWLRRRELQKAQVEIKLPEHSLITQMVERMLEQEQAIKRVFAQDKSRRPLPQLTRQDISVLESVNNALKPVVDFTDILSGENYVTVSSLLPMLAHLEGVLEESKLTADLKRVILEQMEGRYGDDTIQRMMRKATLLDPRYRGDHMKPPELHSTKSEMMEEIVREIALSLPRPTPGPSHAGEDGEEPNAGAATVPKKKKWSLGSLLAKRAATAAAATLTDEQKVESEMTMYLQEMAIDGEQDPLIWWKTNEKKPDWDKCESAQARLISAPSPSHHTLDLSPGIRDQSRHAYIHNTTRTRTTNLGTPRTAWMVTAVLVGKMLDRYSLSRDTDLESRQACFHLLPILRVPSMSKPALVKTCRTGKM
ncbi:E3 SUMO-protein ligase ZBED1-like [Chanodichthys erythropterus]|uniref:E3 SUMO-protein ligase ZBED1-like n=1 Tax=Chanodichthys erythropterus TaxID=933992 RepID=UPI00351DCE9F